MTFRGVCPASSLTDERCRRALNAEPVERRLGRRSAGTAHGRRNAPVCNRGRSSFLASRSGFCCVTFRILWTLSADLAFSTLQVFRMHRQCFPGSHDQYPKLQQNMKIRKMVIQSLTEWRERAVVAVSLAPSPGAAWRGDLSVHSPY